MTDFQKNVALLRKRAPLLADQLMSCDPVCFSDMDEEERKSRLFWEKTGVTPAALHLVFGAGSGAHLRQYRTSIFPRAHSVVVVEKDLPSFLKVVSCAENSVLFEDERFVWCVGLDFHEVYDFAYAFYRDAFHLACTASIHNIIWPEAVAAEGAYYVEVAKLFNEAALHAQKMSVCSAEDNYRGLTHVLENLETLSTTLPVDAFSGFFEGKPGVVISTGPSLDKSIPFLCEHQDSVVIAAVDSAVPILLKHGMTPDFVVSLERVVKTETLFREMSLQEHSCLVFTPVISPKSLALFSGPRLLFLPRGINYSVFFPDQKPHPAGASASTMAYALLALLGCSRIYLLGQDLAFSPDGRDSHATGASSILSNSVKQLSELDKEQVWVMGNNARKIRSWGPYQVIGECFRDLFRQYKRECINVIPSGYGMKIEGVVHAAPEEAFSGLGNEQIPKKNFLRTYLEKNKKQGSFQKSCHSLAKQLLAVHEKALSKQYSLSLFFHQNLPTSVDGKLVELYEKRCAEEESELQQFLRSTPVFPFFLMPFLQEKHVPLFLQYFRLKYCSGSGQEGFFQNQEPRFHVFEQWYQNLQYWSARLAHLCSLVDGGVK